MYKDFPIVITINTSYRGQDIISLSGDRRVETINMKEYFWTHRIDHLTLVGC